MNIFIARLSPTTTREDLSTLFREFGEVTSAKVIFDRETGNSKCYGFIEMPNHAEGENAIKALNESVFQGKSIVVKKAHSTEREEEKLNYNYAT